MSLTVPAWAKEIDGTGLSDSPFQVTSKENITAYLREGNAYALKSYTNGALSTSYIVATDGIIQSGTTITYDNLTATKLVVGHGEVVVLKTDLPTEIKGNGTLLYNYNGGEAPTITGTPPDTGLNALNTLSVSEGQTAHVEGSFGTVSGKVQPVGKVTLGGSGYIVTNDGTSSGGTYDVTINGSAQVSGIFKSLKLNSGATVTITANTYIVEGITIDASSTLNVQQGVTLCVNGNSFKPTKNTTIQSWGVLPVLPEGTYASVAGNWELGGDVTVNTTACGYDSHNLPQEEIGKHENTLNATLNDHTLTIKDGTVKALGAGTVAGDGGKAALKVASNDVNARGAFKSISMEPVVPATNPVTYYTMTVLKDQTISAKYTYEEDSVKNTVTNSVTVLQDTVFTSFNGVLPTRSGEGAPYKFTNLSGKWDTEEAVNPDSYVGDNAILTVNKNGMVISGTFAKLNTGSFSVKLGGNTVIEDGKFSIVGDAEYPSNLTVNGGEGTVTGEFKKLIVNGGTVTDAEESTLLIDITQSGAKDTAIEISDGKLTFSHSPSIRVNGDSSKPAVKVTGGTLTMLNGTVEAWGDQINAIYVADGGKTILGDVKSYDKAPNIIVHGEKSVCLYLNNGGESTMYRGDLSFDGKDSLGIYVNHSGFVKLYPNDEYGMENPTANAPCQIYIHGGTNAMAAMWVHDSGKFEIRGRGARLDQPYREDQGGYALYISDKATVKDGETKLRPLAGGTFNGKVYYQFDGTTQLPIAELIPVNHYVRFDGATPNYGATDGSFGILPYRAVEYDNAFRYGNYVTAHDEANEFNETFVDTLGKRGEYYSIVDAEWELRYQMTTADGSYQLPAGLLDGNGAVIDTLKLDQKDPTNWGIGEMQGDLNVSGSAKLYLAGRTLSYDGASEVTLYHTDVAKPDTFKDALHTVAVTGSLTVLDAVSGGAGIQQDGNKFHGGFIGTGLVRYTGTADDETAAVHVCRDPLQMTSGTLQMTSGKLTNANANGSSSGVYLHSGTASFGTAAYSAESENNDNQIILVNGAKQALKVESTAKANVYGGTLTTYGTAKVYGALLTNGTLNVKGGVLSGNNANAFQSCGVYAKGGTATITGGCLYGIYQPDGNGSSESGTSLTVDGANANVYLTIDGNHNGYTTEATKQTAGRHHICNVNVKSGNLWIGTRGEPDNALRNNGMLTLEGGMTYYFDGVTMRDTVVYGAEVSGASKSFGTQFYVEKGSFGDLKVVNDNEDSNPTYSYLRNGAGSLREYVQLHGGYFQSIDVRVKTDNGSGSVQDVIGVWKDLDHDGTNGVDWARYNHYAEIVSSTRNERGEWSAVTAIQSGTAQTDNVQKISEASGKAISIRCAVDEFKVWAADDVETPFNLYANLWMGDSVRCNTSYCDAVHAPVTVKNGAHTLNLNGFGIFGESEDAMLTVDEGGDLTIVKGDVGATDAYADRIRSFGSSAALSVEDDGTLTVDGAKINSNAATAVSTKGSTTVKDGMIAGSIYGVNQLDGTLDITGGTINGSVNGVNQVDGTLSITDGTITGSNYGVNQLDGTLSITGGTITGTTCGLHRVKSAGDNLNFILGGTFSSIQTEVAGEKLSDLLAEDKTLLDSTLIEVGTDVLARSSVAGSSTSGDDATGGDSVKWTDENTLVWVNPTTTLVSPFTVTDRTVTEIRLESANANTTIAISEAVKADADDNSVKNETKTLYVAKDGGSAVATVTPADGYCTGVVKRNDVNLPALSHKSANQPITLTTKDTSVYAAAEVFHIEENFAGGITGVYNLGKKTYTLTGSNLAKPTVQKEVGGSWEIADDVEINGDTSSYTVKFPDSLTADYKLNAAHISVGGSVAPATTVSVSGDENSVSISASVNKDTATMAEPTDKELEQVIGSGVETGEVIINMSGLNDSVTTAAIPANTVKAVDEAINDAANDATELTIKLPNATATFDAPALSAITKQTKGSSLALTVEEIAAGKLTSSQQSALKQLDVQEILSITLKSGSTVISDFGGGKASISVPYTLKANQNSRGIVVWYVAANGELTEIPATYSAGMTHFTVPHFSNYVIAYDEARATACPQDSTCPMASYSDLKATEWYHDGVHWALEKGVMNGTDDGLFDPNGNTTRAMVVMMLWRMEGSPAYVGMSEYNDVENTDWYGAAVRWASAEGIVTGYDDPNSSGKLFDPNKPVTREQLATMLYRYAEYKGVDVSVGEDTNILSYEDAFSVSDWAMAAMQWACGEQIITGVDLGGVMNLKPQDTATRSVVATILMRFSK
ncbi:MAG: S-layer homology domain-containing protein [Oscillospiraceae bacterium]|nr:S-layer homology domain-containing protein [Oscillospiraceae bacterium]